MATAPVAEEKEMEYEMRKESINTGKVYHVFNKSIAGYKIFNKDSEYLRMFKTLLYYQSPNPIISFSKFLRGESNQKEKAFSLSSKPRPKLVQIIAYCIMPTHLHLVIKQLADRGISVFMNNIQNSYTRYYNILHNRKGPLWEGPFKNVLVDTDEQLLHLTRYVHLNPATAYLISDMEEWQWSSYHEYLSNVEIAKRICEFDDLLEIRSEKYKEFVQDNISYQRELSRIKNLLID